MRATQAELEQMLAPIALYPDPLLIQVLMAATYPLEIVLAQRWLEDPAHKALRGDALAKALEAEAWDPSVKSLVPFPDVLAMLNGKLEWTQRLGDVFLAQQQDVMNAVQVLRARAQASGALASSPQLVVSVADAPPPSQGAAAGATGPAPAPTVPPPQEIISIAPAQPEVVYVPRYDPQQVYGTWPYPAYPPPPPPPFAGEVIGTALLSGMAFAGGVAIVGSLWGWAAPGWGHGDVDINVNRFNAINVNRPQISNTQWRHDVAHRHGVAYSQPALTQRFRGTAAARPQPAANAFRGRTVQPARGQAPPIRHATNGRPQPPRVERSARPTPSREHLGQGRPPGAEPRSRAGAGLHQGGGQLARQERGHALQGIGQGHSVREAAERGRLSRGGGSHGGFPGRRGR